jgi:hypothetical protein
MGFNHHREQQRDHHGFDDHVGEHERLNHGIDGKAARGNVSKHGRCAADAVADRKEKNVGGTLQNGQAYD